MVKVFLKGGVWKNSEDEILKAAIQKYGKQQWARVASLLNRKTAKQAKARWHEWLDPSIRKSEWSRQEEEKLLELAKLMPAQWKTIAPLVGRTAIQCQEHYEFLLDQAVTGGGGDDDAARKQEALRPGQIDSHPESKPAKPDPIDMDEDELEMLQEARARLANTQGKKAKRKQRERMLQNAKRLADLQKRRELKQAGLDIRKRRKVRKQEIDLGVEIPFYKPAPAGFHDVGSEDARADALLQKRLKAVDFQQVNENQFRTRDREAAQAMKREENRLKILEQSNEKYAKARQKEEEELPATRFRAPLQLPEPTAAAAAAALDDAVSVATGIGGTAITQTLTADFTSRSLPTPMRKNLIQEASQLRQLERTQTPLLASAGVDDDMDDMKPPANVDTDDRSVSTFGSVSIRELARQERRNAKRARQQLEEALAALPAPQFEYELAVPQVETVDETEQQQQDNEIVLDQAHVEKAARERQQQKAWAEYEARSSVVKRSDLPRPLHVATGQDEDDPFRQLIAKEMQVLLEHDAQAFPVESKTKKKKRKLMEEVQHQPPAPLQAIPAAFLEDAKRLILEEYDLIVNTKKADAIAQEREISRDDALAVMVDADVQASLNGAANLVYVPDRGWIQAKNEQDTITSLRYELQVLQEASAALKKKNDKTASRLVVTTGGYAKRADKLQTELLQTFGDLEAKHIEQNVYEMLQQHEVEGAKRRTQELNVAIQTLKAAEASLQQKYGELIVEKRRLQVTKKQQH